MSFLAPQFLALTAVVAAALLGLHFLARHRPPAAILPTARFVPARNAPDTVASRRPGDPWLLLLRLATIALAGTALAAPVLVHRDRATARVVVVDLSRAAGSIEEIRDSARALLGEGDALIVVDSVARRVGGTPRDSLAPLSLTTTRGSISAGLVAALRAAAELRDRADSLELVLISPFGREAVDAATPAIRELWRGRARIARVSAATSVPRTYGVAVRGSADDPLRSALSLLGRRAPEPSAAVRLVRDPPSHADTAWVLGGAAGDGGRTLVHWPAAVTNGEPSRNGPPDAVGAVIAGEVVVVAPFMRIRSVAGEQVVARWVDGEPAAVERPVGAGTACIREVAIPIAADGDLVLRASVLRLVDALTSPCGGAGDVAILPDSVVAMLAGTGGLMPAREVPPPSNRTPLAGWLLGGALGLALLEPLARRGGAAR